jgi:hypothetical protein
VPGVLYVATRCHHIAYVPLVPVGTWLIREGSEETLPRRWWSLKFRVVADGVRMPFSLASFLVAWFRVLTVAPGTGLAIFGGAIGLQRLLGGYSVFLLMASPVFAIAGRLLQYWGKARRVAIESYLLSVLLFFAGIPMERTDPWPWLAGGLVLLVAAYVSTWWTRASRERAIELGAGLGITAAAMEGKLPPPRRVRATPLPRAYLTKAKAPAIAPTPVVVETPAPPPARSDNGEPAFLR